MKVWLLLVVVKVCTAFQNWDSKDGSEFSKVWQKDDSGSGVEGSSSDGECYQLESSCRCCKMLHEVNKLNNTLNSRLNDLEHEYNEAKKIHQDLKQKRSAFSATLFIDRTYVNCIPKSGDTSLDVKYEKVFFDLNSDYDTSTGIYTAPHKGYYIISVTIFHDGVKDSNDVSCLRVLKNGAVIAATFDSSVLDQQDSTSVAIAASLDANDQVQVRRKAECKICAKDDDYNVFSVFLLYAE